MKQSKLQQFFKKPGPPDETDKRQENPNKPTEELHEVTEVQNGINPDSRANLGSDKNSKNCDQDMISLGEESGNSTESSESEESDSDDECVDERMNVKAKPKKKKTHYKHKFNSDWLSDKDLQKWIRKDEKDSTRFMCLVCNKSYIGGKTHALRHSKNKFHVKNFEAKQHTTDLANLCSSNVEFKKSVMLQKSVENAELKLSGFIAEHNLPFRVMEHLPGLLKNVFPDSVIAGKITCGRDKTRNIIVKKLAPDADQALSEKLQKCKFSILLDESTDKSVVKSMAVVARFWCPQLKRVCDRLLGLVEVPSATAQIMKGEVDKLLSVRNIPKENCIGFGWDNASVNMGEVMGLKALVKIDNPYVIVVGCVCHSLALCASNASKEIPLEFDEFVRDVYTYIQHSPKRIEAYAEFQGITDTKNHRLLKVCDVRWLSLESVVMRILEQWRALKVYFYEEFKAIKSASAEKVLKMMENVYTKLYLQFLGFILPQVNKLNIFNCVRDRMQYNIGCVLCGNSHQLFRCARCRNVLYCSKEHQKLHWRIHKPQCYDVNSVPGLSLSPSVTTLSQQEKSSYVTEIPFPKGGASLPEAGPAMYQQIACDESGVEREQNNVNQTEMESFSNLPDTDLLFAIDNFFSGAYLDQSMPIREPKRKAYDPDSFINLGPSSTQQSLNPTKNLTGFEHYLEMRRNTAEWMLKVCQYVIQDLDRFGICVIDNFLGKDYADAILATTEDLYDSGVFREGEVVSNRWRQSTRTIRGDQITWVDGSERGAEAIGYLMAMVDSVIMHAKRIKNNGSLGNHIIQGRTKAMVACYPGSGSHYVKHIDNPNKDGRCITSIYYLNKNWDSK
ncbi:hypothetical protein QYM36_015704, partial [Artemia franciscana]